MFKEISIKDVKESPVKLIGDDWALVTAGTKESFNPMTVSWGGLGKLWFKDVATIYIRPQRYTFDFIEQNDYFSIEFFESDKKDVLSLCGKVSGRDVDKVKETGLTPIFDQNAPYFNEAKLVLICKKMAKGRFDPSGFIDESIMDTYKAGDFHYIYYGAIEKVLVKE